MTGKKKYVPQVVIEELDDIKEEYGLDTDRAAMGKMVDYTRVGREMERLMKGKIFGRRPTKKFKRRGNPFKL